MSRHVESNSQKSWNLQILQSGIPKELKLILKIKTYPAQNVRKVWIRTLNLLTLRFQTIFSMDRKNAELEYLLLIFLGAPMAAM